MLSAPDLLHLDARLSLDPESVGELLELSFLGRDTGDGFARSLDGDGGSSPWQAELFAEDLFVDELISRGFPVTVEGLSYPVNKGFLRSVLTAPPIELPAIRFRQDIVRELDTRPEMLEAARQLYRDTWKLIEMFKAPDHTAELDIDSYRLDIFHLAKRIIDHMATGFEGATSGLRRLHDSGADIQASDRYRRLSDLLDFEARLSTVHVSLDLSADGEIRDLRILEIAENADNSFYQPPWKRWLTRLQSVWNGYRLDRRVILHRLLQRVFEDVAPSLVPLLQVLGHLEVYLAVLGFRERMNDRGLEVCLATLEEGPQRLRRLFNPLLVHRMEGAPVPCDLELEDPQAIALITGPNSGGKTRLLQALGLAQVLGQSGFYVPAAKARLQCVRGLFVSLVETERANQTEGRLGRELMRVHSLFSHVGTPALVILDELCSGTNPSEGIEIFSVVLRLLDSFDAAAFISTHFLDYASQLAAQPPHERLEFLRVEPTSDFRSTYQFVPGVARTSLAAETARRLGVTFEELSTLIEDRRRA